MYYLLHPSKPASKTDFSNQMLDDAEAHGGDLSRIAQGPAEGLENDPVWIEFALREGRAIPGWLGLPEDVPEDFKALQSLLDFPAMMAPLRAQTREIDLRLFPDTDEFHAAGDKILEESQKEQLQALQSRLDPPRKQELVDHWIALGGRL